jgi:hypothetical protein
MLHHAFEMLLKAIILEKTGEIIEKDDKNTYSFKKCLCILHDRLKLTTDNQSMTLRIIDSNRDQVMHFYTELSEDTLYTIIQSGVTLFGTILKKSFNQDISEILPGRILPISAHPPKDIALLLNNELETVDRLLAPGKRKTASAAAILRTVLSFTSGTYEASGRTSESDIRRAISKRKDNQDWKLILPEITQLHLSTEGDGIPISMQLSKKADIGIRYAQEGEPVDGYIIKQVIDPWNTYNLGLNDISKKIGITSPKTLAIIYEIRLQEDGECYKELTRKKQVFKGYSKKALDRVREVLPEINVDEVWKRQRHRICKVKANAEPPKQHQ